MKKMKKKKTARALKQTPEVKKPVGRPPKKINEAQVYKLASHGFTMAEIADIVEIHESTLYEYLKANEEFSVSLKGAIAKADSEVVRGLYDRATGFTYTKTVTSIDKATGEIITREVPVYVIPDTVACFGWLNNRRKDQWRPVNKIEVTGKDGAPLIPSKRDPEEELAEILNRNGLVLTKTTISKETGEGNS